MCQPPRRTEPTDVMCIAFIPGDEGVVMGRAKSVGPPPVNPQGPDGPGQRVQSLSSGQRMEVRGLTWMTVEGSSGDWFLARNSGRKQREIDASGSDATSEGKLLRACTSLHLRPEARTMRSTVLRVRYLREISRIGLNGERCRVENQEKVPRWSASGVSRIHDGC